MIALLGLALAASLLEGSADERAHRIESGLLPPVVLRGAEARRLQLDERMKHYLTPALVVAVVDQFEVAWVRAYGRVDASSNEGVPTGTLFQAASISKVVTSLVALKLVEKGALDLDAPLNAKLTSWKIPENDFTRRRPVTLRHVLSHRSGLSNWSVGTYAEGARVPSLLEALDGLPPATTKPVRVEFEPGSRWLYSGGAFSVLQQLLQDVSGKSFDALCRESVFDPLGMKQSRFEQPLSTERRGSAATGHDWEGRPIAGRFTTLPQLAAGGLWTTASDLARLVAAIDAAVAGRSATLVTRETALRLTTADTASWGLGIELRGEGRAKRFFHGGWNPGYRAALVGYPELGRGAVVLANADGAGPLIQEVLRSIAREYDWPGFPPVEKTLAVVSAEELQRCAGTFRLSDGRSIVFESTGERLAWREEGKEGEGLLPESPRRYFSLLDGETSVEFDGEAGSPWRAVTVTIGFWRRTGERTR